MDNFIVIHAYYKPDLEFDDKVSDILTALSSCEKFAHLPIVFGGDFNIHHGSFDFSNLSDIFDAHNMFLCSDHTLTTFYGNNGGISTPDHIFCSRNIVVDRFEVPNRIESDHQPLVLEVRIPLKHLSQIPKTKLDIQSCKIELNNLINQIDSNISCDLAKSVTSILLKCQVQATSKPQENHKVKQLKIETQEAFKSYQRYKTDFFKTIYLDCRKEFRKAVRTMKCKKKENKISNLIESTLERGTQALFKQAKPSSGNHAAQVPLERWFSYYSELYQSFDKPSFNPLAFLPNDSAASLINPFTETEIRAAIMHQKSTARGFNGFNPSEMKKIVDELSPPLTKNF